MENIVIANKKELDEKIKKFSDGGKDNLHVISDFDRTLTKAFVNGEKSSTVIAQIRNGNYLTEDYAPRAHALFNIYRPIEISNDIGFEEKNKKMHEWWKKHFDLLIECGLNKNVIEEVVKNSSLEFRNGCVEFLDYINKNNIPLIIMSAGPGDMIIEHLKKENSSYKNIHLVANMFIFNKKGLVTKIKEPIIHSLNKYEIETKNLPIYNKLLKRKNVILLGDSLEDIGMVEGFPYNNLIKIGFLNEETEKNLKEYKKNYDVIILNDGTMDYVNGLLKKITG